MEFIRRAKYIAGSYSLLTEHSHFNISSRMISNSRFAEAIIGKYTLPDEYDLPPVSYVYYDPAFARDEGEQLILLSSYLMTLNHFCVSMFHTAYENHFYRAVKLQCQQLFLALSQSLPWQREVRELREIYREIGSRQNEAQKKLEISGTGEETLHRRTEEDRRGQTEEDRQGQTEEDRQGQEAANRRLLTVKKRTERTLAFIERQGETRFPDRNGASKRTSKPADGMSVRIGMGQGRMAASSWKSEQAKAFFWRVQRSSAWEQSLLFQAAEVTSLVGLMKLLQRMEPEHWRREAPKLRERLEVMAASGEFEKALKPESRKTEEIRQDFLRETREAVTYLEKEEWETFIGELVRKRAQLSEETDGPFFQWLEEHVHRSETKESVSLSEEKRSFLLALSQQVERDAAVLEERKEKRRRRLERQLSEHAPGKHSSETVLEHRPSELASEQRLPEPTLERQLSEPAPGHGTTASDGVMPASEKRLLYEEVMEAVSYLDQNEWKEFREELFQYRFRTVGKLSDAENGEPEIIPDAEALKTEVQEAEEIQTLSPVLQWIREQRESREETVSFGEEKLSFLNAMSGELERLEQSEQYRQDARLDLLLRESHVLGTYMTWQTEAKAVPGQNPSETILEHRSSEIASEHRLSEPALEYQVSESEPKHHLFESAPGHHSLELAPGHRATHSDEEIPVSEKRLLYEEVMEAVSYLDQEEWKEFREELFQYRFRTARKLSDAENGEPEIMPDAEALETEVQEAEEIQTLSPVLQWIRKQREIREGTVSFGEEKLSFLNAMSGELERLEQGQAKENRNAGLDMLFRENHVLRTYMTWRTEAKAMPGKYSSETALEHRPSEIASEQRLSEPALERQLSESEPENHLSESAPGHGTTASDGVMPASEKRLLYEEVMETVSYLDQEEWKEFREELFRYRFRTAGKLSDVEKGEPEIIPDAEALETEVREAEEIQTLSPVLQWIRKQRESREETVSFGEEKLSFLNAMSGELERLEQGQVEENRNAGLDLLLQESRVLGTYMTWRTETKAVPGKRSSETVLKHHLSEPAPEHWITVLDKDMPVSKKRLLYEEMMEAVSYLNQEEWKKFREELFQHRFRTVGKFQTLSPVLQWIREQKKSREETVSFGEEKRTFLNAMSGELERLEQAEEIQTLSPILQWISRQAESRQAESGQEESREGESGLWQENGSEKDGSKLVYRVQSRLEELIFPNGKTKRVAAAPGTYSSLLVQNLWMQAAKGEKGVSAPGTAQGQMRFAGSEAAQDRVRPAGLETALEMVEHLRTERLRTGGSEVLEEAGETMPAFYRPASLVITQTGAGRGKRGQEADEGIAASLNTKIETEVVRQVKEQVTDIQFISKSGAARDDQTAADRETVRRLAEQLERQQQELEMLRGRQNLVYENPGISKLSKSVIRKVQSQLNQERMRRGI